MLYVYLYRKLHPSESIMDVPEARTKEDILRAIELWQKPQRLSHESYESHIRAIIDLVRSGGASPVFVAVPVNPYWDPGPPEEVRDGADVLDAIDQYIALQRSAAAGRLDEVRQGLDTLIESHPSPTRSSMGMTNTTGFMSVPAPKAALSASPPRW